MKLGLQLFVRLFELVKCGAVGGLAGPALSAASPKHRDGVEAKQRRFRSSLGQGPGQGPLSPRGAGFSTGLEEERRREGSHGRALLSESLSSAADEWRARTLNNGLQQPAQLSHVCAGDSFSFSFF